MTIAHMIGIVSPILRSLGTHNIDRFRRYIYPHNRAFRLQNHAVAGLQDRTARKRDRKLQPTIRSAASVALPPLFPCQSERIVFVIVILGTNVFSSDGFLYDGHTP